MYDYISYVQLHISDHRVPLLRLVRMIIIAMLLVFATPLGRAESITIGDSIVPYERALIAPGGQGMVTSTADLDICVDSG
jgi:hypothetical protein